MRIDRAESDRWWLADKECVGDRLFSYYDRLRQKVGNAWRERFVTWARLYNNSRILGLGPTQYTARVDDASMRLNLIGAVIETLLSKISSSRPAPQFLTSGADYKLRRKTKKLNKFGKGTLHQTKTYEIAPMILLDALVFGTGIEKVFGDHEEQRLCGERVFPWELLLDPIECWYGQPRTWVQRKYVERDVLLERFGGNGRSQVARAIRDATKASADDLGRDLTSDQVLVLEAWRLPSSSKAKDGRHIIAIQGCVLRDEPWTRERAPFAVFRWREPLVGFWGTGVAESLMPTQFELNTLLQKIQKAFALVGVPRVLLDEASGIPKEHITNDIGAILRYRAGSNPPVVIAPQTIHPEVFAQVDRLWARGFEQEGVSQMSAAASKPAGLDSGEALREYGDQTSERFVAQMRRWETFHMDVVRISLDEVRSMGGVRVDVPDRNAKDEVDWKDVSLEDNAYVLQCFPMALLPQQPAARQQRIEELTEAGWFTRDEAMELMDFPDMEEAVESATAPRTSIRQRIDRMLDGEYIAPEPFDVAQGPQSPAITMVLAAYLVERERGCPDNILQLLRDWLEACDALLNPPQAPTIAGPTTTPVDPMAMPQGGAPMVPMQAPAAGPPAQTMPLQPMAA